MEKGQVDTLAYEQLIKAVNEYQEKVMNHYRVIQNAANLCDQAMGSDDLSKKQIAKLNEAAAELLRTADKARSMAERLVDDYRSQNDIYDGIN